MQQQSYMSMAMITPRKCIQTILCLALVAFVVINVNYISLARVEVSDPDTDADVLPETIPQRKPRTNDLSHDNHVDKVVSIAPVAVIKDSIPNQVVPIKGLANKTNFDTLKAKALAAAEESAAQRDSHFNESLSFIIKDINGKQTIRNMDKFPPNSRSTYNHALVIQVHNRDHYLSYLVDSLRATRDVNSSLLIVSHDFYSKEVFDIVNSIDFMPVS